MAPYAVGLCQNLVAAFWRLTEDADQAGAEEDEDEDEENIGVMAAWGCLRAITTVLESVSSLPQLFPQVSFQLMWDNCQFSAGDGALSVG